MKQSAERAGTVAPALAKGANFTGILRALEKRLGSEAHARVMAQLPADVAGALNHGQILTVGWYPVTWYAELHAAIDRALGRGTTLARALGHDATLLDFSTVHRLLAAMLSAETVFGQTHRIMSLYWKGGTVERLALSRGHARVRFENWFGFSALVWEDIIGSTAGILTFCGARNIRCRPNVALDDAHTLELDVRWG